MSQNLDKNKICNSIQKSLLQDLFYVNINDADKNAKKIALKDIEKIIRNGRFEIVLNRKKD